MVAAESPPDVSIIVLAFNAEKDLPGCLDSVRRHAAPLSVQTIVVDYSEDGSRALLAARYPEVEVIALERNEGLPARNYGLRRARGRFRMFLDSDARLTEGALATLVEALERTPRAGLAGPKLVYEDGGLQLSARRYPPLLLPVLRRPPLSRWLDDAPVVRHHLMADDPPARRRRVEYVIGACQLWTREAEEAAGELDWKIFQGPEDTDWCFSIRSKGFDVLYVPEAVVVHGYRRSSAKKPFSLRAARQLMGTLYFQRKWWRSRRRLIAEGRTMDAEAERVTTATPSGAR